MQITIVEKNNHRGAEPFDPEKLHRSIVKTCCSVRVPDGQAEDIAAQVTFQVIDWCKEKPEITANDIRRTATTSLESLHSDAAYMYKNDKLMI